MATQIALSQQAFSILVYDVTNRASFEKLEGIVENFNQNCKHDNRILYIVGNKCESDAPRQVTFEDGKKFAETYCYKYFEISAKDGTNVDTIFMKAAEQVCDNIKKNRYDPNIRLEKFGIQKLA